MRAAAESIVQDMRSNPYPYFLEVVTYRYVGHGAADRAKLRRHTVLPTKSSAGSAETL